MPPNTSQPKKQIRSIQLPQDAKFIFGTITQFRFNQDATSCNLVEKDDYVLMELYVKNDNSVRTYRIPFSLCIVEYV